LKEHNNCNILLYLPAKRILYRATHTSACVATTWISYRCVPCHPWCTHRTSL